MQLSLCVACSARGGRGEGLLHSQQQMASSCCWHNWHRALREKRAQQGADVSSAADKHWLQWVGEDPSACACSKCCWTTGLLVNLLLFFLGISRSHLAGLAWILTQM